jgi:hypothetical protein
MEKAYEMTLQQRKDMKKILHCRDIDVRIKSALIYNNFRSRFPDLYGRFNKDSSLLSMRYPFLILYHLPDRRYSRFKTEMM